MRVGPIVVALAACGGAMTRALPPRPRAPAPAPAIHPPRAPIDVIGALSATQGEVSWMTPGPAQLALGAPPIQPEGSSAPIQVVVIDDQGSQTRVGVLLDHVRFAVWTDRAQLFTIVAHDIAIHGDAFADLSQGDAPEVVLRGGARVRRLAHDGARTRIRYVGGVEVEGWVPDDALVDRGPARDPVGWIPRGRQVLSVIPGAVIRSEPRWAGQQLAVMANGYFVDSVREIDDAWSEVEFEDGEVAVRGYLSRRDPPGRVHRTPAPESVAAPVAPNATVASGTCLYGRDRGEPIGYVVGDRPALVEPGDQAGWFDVSLDTPWGPVAFAARGPSESELGACAPPGAVPPPAVTSP
ncbi:MAG TPA: hypothetical protein VLX92_04640 [Kofleriaceae bacterium]|nr:hypothetical protein [Kofleriaceae bacterium]